MDMKMIKEMATGLLLLLGSGFVLIIVGLAAFRILIDFMVFVGSV